MFYISRASHPPVFFQWTSHPVFYKQPWHQNLEQVKILLQEVKLEENFTLPFIFERSQDFTQEMYQKIEKMAHGDRSDTYKNYLI